MNQTQRIKRAMSPVRVLPTFRGYTVDERLRQFRKAEYGKRLEFVEFDSPKGMKLLSAYREAEYLRYVQEHRALEKKKA